MEKLLREVTEEVAGVLSNSGGSLPLTLKKKYFSLLVLSGQYKSILKRKRQKEIFEMCYGAELLRESEVANLKGLTQQTINKTKLRAEKHLLNHFISW